MTKLDARILCLCILAKLHSFPLASQTDTKAMVFDLVKAGVTVSAANKTAFNKAEGVTVLNMSHLGIVTFANVKFSMFS